MSGILDLLQSDIGKQIIGGVSNHTQTPENKTTDLLGMALPMLTGAMKRNVSTTSGAEGLLGALNKKHDGSILNDLGGLFDGGVNDEVMQDGAGILKNVLGTKQPAIEQALSAKSGVNAGAVGQVLKIAAPLLMGFLGKQAKTQNVRAANGMGGLLGSVMGNQPRQHQGFLESLLDADGDGSVMDDVANMVTGKNRGGLGNALGGLFDGK